MKRTSKDLPSTILRIVIAFVMGAIAFALLMLAIGFIVMPFAHSQIAAELAKESMYLPMWQAIVLIEGLIAGIIVLLGLVEYFFLLLWRILSTVREGNPFAPANSTRLSRMAWTSVAAYLWSLGLAAYLVWLEAIFAEALNDAHIEIDTGTGGLVLILVLFVLARVFRQGTAMREDLEGTV